MSQGKNKNYIPELENLTILIVDDCEDQINLNVKIIKSIGAQKIIQTTQPEEALEKVKSEKVDLIVSDWQMPRMNGGLLLQKIKEIEEYKKIPFLICSGQLQDEDICLAVEFGVGNYLIKPFNAEKYAEKLREVLQIGKKKSKVELELDGIEKLIQQGKGSEVIDKLLIMRQKFPKAIRIVELMGDCYDQTEDYGKAIDTYKAAIKVQPKNLRVLNKLSSVLIKNKDIQKAIVLLEQLRVLSPKNLKRLISLGGAYLDNDQPEKAEEAYGSARKVDKTNAEATDGMGKALFTQGKYSQAVEFLKTTEKALEMASYFNNLGIVLVKQKRYEEARKLYANALNILPPNDRESLLLFNIGLAFKKNAKLDEAAVFFKATAEKNPDFAKAQVNLEEVFNKTNEDENVDFGSWCETLDSSKVEKTIQSYTEDSSAEDIAKAATETKPKTEEKPDDSLEIEEDMLDFDYLNIG